MVKKGDTLIEVTLAIGIFSMIAIAVVSVVNSSTSGAQSALETTLAREEIDIQAEALRFIHSSYISNKDAGPDNEYAGLWEAIVEKAISEDGTDEDALNQILDYTPKTCSDLYKDDKLTEQGAFIIDTKQLASHIPNFIVRRADEDAPSSADFRQTLTYPRIVYSESGDSESILDQGSGDTVYGVEGIYIIAVKDRKSTLIVPEGSSSPLETSAYYDFYIRTCWYSPGASRPSTISTVIRLYNPDIDSPV